MKKKDAEKKLTLDKKSIAILTRVQMSNVRAGNLAFGAVTSSNGILANCTTIPTSGY